MPGNSCGLFPRSKNRKVLQVLKSSISFAQSSTVTLVWFNEKKNSFTLSILVANTFSNGAKTCEVKSLTAMSIPIQVLSGLEIHSAKMPTLSTSKLVEASPNRLVFRRKPLLTRFLNCAVDSLQPLITSSSIPPLMIKLCVNRSQSISDRNLQIQVHPCLSKATFLNDSFSRVVDLDKLTRMIFTIWLSKVTLSKITVMMGAMARKSENDKTSMSVGFGLSIFKTCNGLVFCFSCFKVAGIGRISRKWQQRVCCFAASTDSIGRCGSTTEGRLDEESLAFLLATRLKSSSPASFPGSCTAPDAVSLDCDLNLDEREENNDCFLGPVDNGDLSFESDMERTRGTKLDSEPDRERFEPERPCEPGPDETWLSEGLAVESEKELDPDGAVFSDGFSCGTGCGDTEREPSLFSVDKGWWLCWAACNWACCIWFWTSLEMLLLFLESFFAALPRNSQSTSPLDTPGLSN
ncbi:hypothetical protein OGATHE_004144 [Ogataea polymorpha]|uniref:Uncharacterized protein n=1 Tax=Ogataea polymorpha TaxID=460523 RepID=A0A9P8T3W5_9ASCO|nr:hypothetical protein OGATHE_004144 [Ogataea polymorpha]